MPQVSLTRRYRFSAAHRLHTPTLSDADNQKIFGKCNNPNGHGHNYVLFVTIAERGKGERISWKQGEGIDALDAIVNTTVVQRFDHQDLNLDPGFSTRTTTGENLAKCIWEILTSKSLPGRLEKVGIVETRDNYFEFAG